MVEFDIEDKHYRTFRKLNAFEQIYLALKIAPLVVSLRPSAELRARLDAEAAAKANGGDAPAVDLTELAMPVIMGLSKLEREEIDFVTQTCVAVVQQQQVGGGWSNIWHAGSKRMQFEDIDGMAVMRITFEVIQENLGNFMRAPLSITPSPSPMDTASHVSS